METGLAEVNSISTICTEELVTRAREGERESFDELYFRHAPAVTRRLTYLTGVSGPVSDLVQETFVQAFRNLAQFRGDAAFSHWVLRIATNVARTHQRRRTRRIWRLWDRPEEADRVASPLASVDASFPDLQAVHRALDRLSVTLREAVILHEMEGLSLAEIAAVQEVSINTAASRVRRGRERLKGVLEGMGFSQMKSTAAALCSGNQST